MPTNGRTPCRNESTAPNIRRSHIPGFFGLGPGLGKLERELVVVGAAAGTGRGQKGQIRWGIRVHLCRLLRGESGSTRQMLTPKMETRTKSRKRLRCTGTNTHRPAEGAARWMAITTCSRPRNTPMRSRHSHPGSRTIAQLELRGENGCRQWRGEDRCQSLMARWLLSLICCSPSPRCLGSFPELFDS